MLVMLADDTPECRRFVAPLFDPVNLSRPDRWPKQQALHDYLQAARSQPELFHDDYRRREAASRTRKVDSGPLRTGPRDVEGVPSPWNFDWAGGRIRLDRESSIAPVFPFPSSARDHEKRLEACRVQAQDLADDIQRRRWQVREDYGIELQRYIERLPDRNGDGNMLLADAASRNLRTIFAADADFLPSPFAARLKTVLEQHIALRPFYPEVEALYRAIQSGRIDEPLPLDAVTEFLTGVRAQTPAVFDASVAGAIEEVSTPEAWEPASEYNEVVIADDEVITPPPDPLGTLPPDAGHDVQVAASINRLWKVFISGERIHAQLDAWSSAYQMLSGPAGHILKWLGRFIAG